MKVQFEATMEDFVDVALRSRKVTWEFYLAQAISILGTGIILGIMAQLIWGNAILTAVVVLAITAISIFQLYKVRERSARKTISELYRPKWPVIVDVEISEAGLSFKQFGTNSTYDWKIIASIGEVGDAIYFQDIFGRVSAVRTRAFTSESEKDEFVQTASRYMADVRSVSVKSGELR